MGAMVAEVARVYHSLPPEVQAKTAIKADNYGEAARLISSVQNMACRRHRRSSKLLAVGTAPLYRREHDPVGEGEPEPLPRSSPTSKSLDTSNIRWRWRRRTSIGTRLKWNLQEIWPKIKRWR